MYKVKEIFKSIQGEGFYSGMTAVFVRFSGCNLWSGKNSDKKKAICKFCDTDFFGINGKNGGIYSLDKLIKQINNVWNYNHSSQKKFVVLTGGEPLLQINHSLLKKLHNKNFFVSVETNGTIKTNLNFDWITVSPKEDAKWRQRSGNELKLVYPQTKFDLKKIVKLDFNYFFLQPKDDFNTRINIYKTLNYCKAHKPWFPSFQIHKSLGLN
jgi:7-carboxy-7-deazaguanine synthase (Cx14CxxC type)